ncbi:hypothetical protein V2O64_02135 [Verrucomicrobiaceae bacterium 227]
MMGLKLIDGIGPFFVPVKRRRLNWSKIPFHDLPSGPDSVETWVGIRRDLREFASHAVAEGFNAITLDDVAHLTDHLWYEGEVREKISFFAWQFKTLITDLKEMGLSVYLTSDVITLSEGVGKRLGKSREARRAFYFDLLNRFFDTFPEVDGVILRIGESDGLDVHDSLRSELHLRSAGEANAFLKELLPIFEARNKTAILRTWTVGAHRIGDLIWRKGTLERLVRGIESDAFVLSMKPGDSDFFRYLPLSESFTSYRGAKIVELQARPEYEGAGELPTYLGQHYERYAHELKEVENLVGFSVWCQTGGWHRFRRMSFFGEGSPWVENNARVALRIFTQGMSSDEALRDLHLPGDFFSGVERLVREAFYLPSYASQPLFFRRVRIPPLLHVYWDTVFLIAPVRKLMRFFVKDHAKALREGEEAMLLLPGLIKTARELTFPARDLEFFGDTLEMMRWARRYYFGPFSPELAEEIEAAKSVYKLKWPKNGGCTRFRIRTDFQPMHLKRRTLRWGTRMMLRRRRAYRFVDYVFVLTLMGVIYRWFRRSRPKALPSFVRKSAMGVDSVFK